MAKMTISANDDVIKYMIDSIKNDKELSELLKLEDDDKDMIEVKIKYTDQEVTKLKTIEKGDWIDLYAAEDITLKQGEFALVSLGFAMEFPPEYEAHLLPRSSTFKKWGIIQTNSMGIIDHTYCGDTDIWKMPVYCLAPRHGDVTRIEKGDKICQFRLMKRMEEVKFNEVDTLGNEDRGGFGSTGNK